MPKTVFENITRTIPGLTANGDLSADQFKFVYVSGDLQVSTADASDKPAVVGVLQNKPTDGQAATVATNGSVTKVVAGQAFNPGTEVTTDGSGRAVASVLGQQQWGTTMTTCTAIGDLVSIMLLSGGPS